MLLLVPAAQQTKLSLVSHSKAEQVESCRPYKPGL